MGYEFNRYGGRRVEGGDTIPLVNMLENHPIKPLVLWL